jgi:hypothetical protein
MVDVVYRLEFYAVTIEKRVQFPPFTQGENMKIQIIVSNICMCKKCGDIIESFFRHDFKRCGCGAIFVDGGKEYFRRGATNPDLILDLSQYYEEDC